MRRADGVLHLHGFHHRQRLASAHALALAGEKAHHLAGHGCGQTAAFSGMVAGMGDGVDL